MLLLNLLENNILKLSEIRIYFFKKNLFRKDSMHSEIHIDFANCRQSLWDLHFSVESFIETNKQTNKIWVNSFYLSQKMQAEFISFWNKRCDLYWLQEGVLCSGLRFVMFLPGEVHLDYQQICKNCTANLEELGTY